MTGKNLLLSSFASALLLTGAIAGCGGDDDPSPSTGTTAPAGQVAGGKVTGQTGNGPASANDERGDAPDDKISDRPGGPNSGPPVNPDPAN